MDEFIAGVIVVLVVLALLFVGAVVSGTVLWLIWPIAVSAFPGLIASGVLAQKISWGVAVCVCWAFSILFKNNTTANASKKN